MRHKKPTLVDYNRRVVAYLQTISAGHAALLNSEGSRLGWWDTIAHYFYSGVGAPEAARRIAEEPDPYATVAGGTGCEGPEGQHLSCFL